MDGMYGGGSAASTGPADYDIDIEVYGIVYLFNPVDLDRLGLNQVTEDTELETTVDTPAENLTPNSSAAGAADPTQPNNGTAPGTPNAGQPAPNANVPNAGDPANGANPAGTQGTQGGNPNGTGGTTPEPPTGAGAPATPPATPPANG